MLPFAIAIAASDILTHLSENHLHIDPYDTILPTCLFLRLFLDTSFLELPLGITSTGIKNLIVGNLSMTLYHHGLYGNLWIYYFSYMTGIP